MTGVAVLAVLAGLSGLAAFGVVVAANDRYDCGHCASCGEQRRVITDPGTWRAMRICPNACRWVTL